MPEGGLELEDKTELLLLLLLLLPHLSFMNLFYVITFPILFSPFPTLFSPWFLLDLSWTLHFTTVAKITFSCALDVAPC
jgi:hypothetical protein